ncbi:MAG: SPOR domain-containing protein [Paracoccaceae bacterium]
MAEIQYGDVGVDAPVINGAHMAGVVNWLGALVSVTLMAGLAFWGYQLMVRDVSGVPVVRALEGPMRITPLDPGGSNAQHQGLAVNNIAAVGEAEAPADRLVLAPKPTALGAQDPTAAELQEIQATLAPVVPQDSDVIEMAAVSPAALNDAASAAPMVTDQAALIEAALRQVEDISAVADMAAGDVVAASVAGVARSLRPMARPAVTHSAPVIAAPDGPVSGQVNSINPDDVPVGTRLAQLGAFETPEIAQGEWMKISARFEEFMTDKSQVIEQAQSGGKVFYRLRAHGFEDLSDARRFCSALLAGQANCIPVVTR